MVYLIGYKQNSWHIFINDVECYFTCKPIALYIGNNIFCEEPSADNGLRWRINRKWVSYNQIKKAINGKKTNSCKRHH